MFGLGKHGPDGRYGAILDIGSGSVGVAIVASDPLKKRPEIIWSHREHMLIRDIDSLDESAKHITAALMNAILTLGNNGLKELKSHDTHARLDTLQIAISAPWSYTITKTISFKKEESFSITKQLVSDLVKTARKEALAMLDENDIVQRLGLKVITRATIDMKANNYSTSESVYGQDATSLSVSHVSAITTENLLTALDEVHKKVIPETKLFNYSFMLLFYCISRQLKADITEVCLIDITHEATEIGIVRDGTLRYVTHAPYGIATLARDIAKTCDIPKAEAMGYIRGFSALTETMPQSKAEQLVAVTQNYITVISELFKRTGDSLAIPRTLFLHTDKNTEAFFSESIKKAATLATSGEHSVHLITSKLLEEDVCDDTALLLSANFFHNQETCDDFEQV